MTFFDAWCFLEEHKIFNVFSQVPFVHVGNDPLYELLSEATKKEIKSTDMISSRTSYFERGLSIMIVKVNPETMAIEVGEKEHANTLTQVWLETGPIVLSENGEVEYSHEYDLDSSGDTFEEAILALADKVKSLYGDDVTGSQLSIKH